MDPDQLLVPDLDDVERRLLRGGIVEWGGPARCTEEMAIAMGFEGVQDLLDSTRRLVDAITAGTALTAADWLRVLLATEIVFASNTIGSGLDWAITTGLSDAESLAALRSVQHKLAGIGNLLGVTFGTGYRLATEQEAVDLALQRLAREQPDIDEARSRRPSGGSDVAVRFEPVRWPEDADDVASFLAANSWPFHGTPSLTAADAAEVTVVSDDVASFWIHDRDETIGLVRLLDLADLDDGSPLFDLRIAESHRRRGIGRSAVDWLTDHLFTTYPELHRIEATTRHDNAAMQAVFARCGYRQEGRFVEAWKNADGTRHDALTYAILRREHAGRADQ